MGEQKNAEKFDVRCPVCKQKICVGFLGGSSCRKYFCKECFIEFTIKNSVITIIIIDDNYK